MQTEESREALCDDPTDGGPQDLDFDDFTERLRLHVEGGMH
jgi:hypothetical protein